MIVSQTPWLQEGFHYLHYSLSDNNCIRHQIQMKSTLLPAPFLLLLQHGMAWPEYPLTLHANLAEPLVTLGEVFLAVSRTNMVYCKHTSLFNIWNTCEEDSYDNSIGIYYIRTSSKPSVYETQYGILDNWKLLRHRTLAASREKLNIYCLTLAHHVLQVMSPAKPCKAILPFSPLGPKRCYHRPMCRNGGHHQPAC